MANIHLAIAADFLLAEKLLEALEESQLEIEHISAVELNPFGEEHHLRFGAKSIPQLTLEEVDWSQFSHILFAGNMQKAEVLAKAVQAGCIVLDLYGISALIENVPVVVPSLNNEAIVNVREHNIVALANPQISQLALALKPFLDQPIQQIFVSSLLPAAYFGDEKVRELAGQTAQLLNGIPLDEDKPRVAFDAVPANTNNETLSPFTKTVELQLAKVLPTLSANIQLHSVQVPVFYGISQMVSIQTEFPFSPNEIEQQWHHHNWINFNAEKVITPVQNGENEENNQLQISQLLLKDEHHLQFWSVADEQRFSLAFLSIELLKEVLEY